MSCKTLQDHKNRLPVGATVKQYFPLGMYKETVYYYQVTKHNSKSIQFHEFGRQNKFSMSSPTTLNYMLEVD
jgi:hypothetical protein